jgi:hypothetical protein
MRALVMDTSIVVDLERAGLQDAAFQFGWVIVVPDYLYEQELASNSGPYLRSLGLGVLELAPQEVELAQQIRSTKGSLSWPDCFAAALATRPKSILLCGDANLRAEAERRKIDVHGLLWLLDQMEIERFPTDQLRIGLERVSEHRHCRLPKQEVAMRIARWGN